MCVNKSCFLTFKRVKVVSSYLGLTSPLCNWQALAEVARLKEKLVKQRDSVSDVTGEKEERLMKQEKEIRLLERQRVRWDFEELTMSNCLSLLSTLYLQPRFWYGFRRNFWEHSKNN